MTIYVSEDKQVTKHVHLDGSETCIKTVPSLDVTAVAGSGEVTYHTVDRDKYSVFISDSCGCPLNCSFCYLTIDEVPYRKLREHEVFRNLAEAVVERVALEPEIKSRYIKLCWMGMGEAIIRPLTVARTTIEFLDWIKVHNYAMGLDGVDISTVLPDINDHWIDEFIALNRILSSDAYELNPKNRKADNVAPGSTFVTYTDRSVFRVFYSLHSAVQETRDFIIPNAMSLANAAPRLRLLADNGVDVIFHHMFLEGINDSEQELEELVRFMNQFPDSELRILRYNKHEDSSIRESYTFEECMCYLAGKVAKIKVQVSQGADVKSACGQFIYNNEHRVQEYAKLDALT